MSMEKNKRERLPLTQPFTENELRVVKKRVISRYPNAFRKMAVERLKSCNNIVALSKQLGVHRRLLYKWRDQLEPKENREGPTTNSLERELLPAVSQLKRLGANRTVEADFARGVLQRIQARRQAGGATAKRLPRTKSRSDA